MTEDAGRGMCAFLYRASSHRLRLSYYCPRSAQCPTHSDCEGRREGGVRCGLRRCVSASAEPKVHRLL